MKSRIEHHQCGIHFTESCPIFVNRWEEGFTLPEHFHDFIEITYIAEGFGYHYVNGKEESVRRGDILFLPINTSHVFRPASLNPKNSLIVYNCIFPQEVLLMSNFPSNQSLHKLFTLWRTDNYGFHRWWDGEGTIIQLFDEMHQEYSLKLTGYEHLLFSNLMKLLVILYRMQTIGTPIVDTSERLHKILSYINIHYTESLTLETISKISNLSKRHFYRLFLQVTKQTFTGYIQNKRMDQSCRLLKTTTRKITDISRDVGYKDSKFYSVLFKKKYGMTPSMFRKLK